MPVEDIGFLKQNSEKKSNIVLIDSAHRDVVSFPKANMYVVHFQEPFTNVTGLEVLDASVPRTMYVVDIHNNKLVIYTGSDVMVSATDSEGHSRVNLNKENATRVNITIPIGDYALEELISSVNVELLQYSMELLPQSDKTARLSSVYIKSDTAPFVVDMNESTCREVLGFGDISSNVDSNLYQKVYESGNENHRLFGSVFDVTSVLTNQHFRYTRYMLSESALPYFAAIPIGLNNYRAAYSRFSLSMVSDNDFYRIKRLVIPLRNIVSVLDTNYRLSIKLLTSTAGTTFQDPIITTVTSTSSIPSNHILYQGTIEVLSYSQVVERGYDITFLVNVDELPSQTTFVYGIVNIEENVNLFLHGNKYYWIEVSTFADISQQCVLFVDSKEFALDNLSRITSYAIVHDHLQERFKVFDFVDDSPVWLLPNYDNTALFPITVIDAIEKTQLVPTSTMLFGITYERSTHSVYAPGVVSLIGPRYMLLRIPEIEAHTQSSYAYTSTSQGMALFKLGLYGYRDTRYDFSSINYLPFHPIARLSKLTMMFTLPEGVLYDFKGVEHHLLLSIQTLVPMVNVGDIVPQLNPNYTPNIIEYLTRQRIDELQIPASYSKSFNNNHHTDPDPDPDPQDSSENDNHDDDEDDRTKLPLARKLDPTMEGFEEIDEDEDDDDDDEDEDDDNTTSSESSEDSSSSNDETNTPIQNYTRGGFRLYM